MPPAVPDGSKEKSCSPRCIPTEPNQLRSSKSLLQVLIKTVWRWRNCLHAFWQLAGQFYDPTLWLSVVPQCLQRTVAELFASRREGAAYQHQACPPSSTTSPRNRSAPTAGGALAGPQEEAQAPRSVWKGNTGLVRILFLKSDTNTATSCGTYGLCQGQARARSHHSAINFTERLIKTWSHRQLAVYPD